MIEYAHRNSCLWDEQTRSFAALGGYLECLDYASRNGCEWDLKRRVRKRHQLRIGSRAISNSNNLLSWTHDTTVAMSDLPNEPVINLNEKKQSLVRILELPREKHTLAVFDLEQMSGSDVFES